MNQYFDQSTAKALYDSALVWDAHAGGSRARMLIATCSVTGTSVVSAMSA